MFSWRTPAGVLLAFVVFEVMLRQLTFGHVTLDPRVGWMWRSTTVVHRLGEGWGVSHWRDDETRAHAPAAPNAPRVLVVGDSFTEALQVGDDEVFSARMPNVNALNIGQSGHSAAEYVAFAAEYRARYRPDWTVVELAPQDLAGDSFIQTKTHFDEGLNPRVIIMSDAGGRITGKLKPIRRRSNLIDFAMTRVQEYSAGARMPPLFRAADEETRPIATIADVSTNWPVAAEMARLRNAYSDRLTFFFVPDFFVPPSGVEEVFTAECRKASLSCVNMRTVFDDYRNRGEAPFGFPNSKFGKGHLNASGHAAAARLLESEMERLRARGLF
jgi:hypothetical protein